MEASNLARLYSFRNWKYEKQNCRDDFACFKTFILVFNLDIQNVKNFKMYVMLDSAFVWVGLILFFSLYESTENCVYKWGRAWYCLWLVNMCKTQVTCMWTCFHYEVVCIILIISKLQLGHGRHDERSWFDAACLSESTTFLLLTIKAVYCFRCSGMLAARWYRWISRHLICLCSWIKENLSTTAIVATCWSQISWDGLIVVLIHLQNHLLMESLLPSVLCRLGTFNFIPNFFWSSLTATLDINITCYDKIN